MKINKRILTTFLLLIFTTVTYLNVVVYADTVTELSFNTNDFSSIVSPIKGSDKLTVNSNTAYTYGDATYSAKIDLNSQKWGTNRLIVPRGDFTSYESVSIRFYSTKADVKFALLCQTNVTTGDSDDNDNNYYIKIIDVDKTGWQIVTIPRSEFKSKGVPGGWDKITGIQIRTDDNSVTIGGTSYKVGSGTTPGWQLYFDKIWLSTLLNNPTPSIENNAFGVPADIDGNREVSFTFDTNITVSDNAVAVYKNTAAVASSEYNVSVSGNVLKVKFSENLEEAEKYRLVINKDSVFGVGNEMLQTDFELAFTAGYVFEILGSTPADNTAGVNAQSSGYTYVLEFSKDLDETVNYKNYIKIKQNGTVFNADFTTSVSGKFLTLTFNKPLKGEREYEVSIQDGAFNSKDGQVLKGDFSSKFTTVADPLVISDDGVIFDADDADDMKNFLLNNAGTEVTTFAPFSKAGRITYEAKKDKKAYISKKSGDITGYAYINYLIYNPDANNCNEECVILMECPKSSDGKTPYYVKYITTDWTGWKVISLKLADFNGVNSPNSKADVNSYCIDFGGWSKTRSNDGYIDVRKIWLSNEAPLAPSVKSVNIPDNYQNMGLYGEKVIFEFEDSVIWTDAQIEVKENGVTLSPSNYTKTPTKKQLVLDFEEFNPDTEYEISITGILSDVLVAQDKEIKLSFKTVSSGVFVSEINIGEYPTRYTAEFITKEYGSDNPVLTYILCAFDSDNALVKKEELSMDIYYEDYEYLSIDKDNSDIRFLKAYVLDDSGKMLSNKFASLSAGETTSKPNNPIFLSGSELTKIIGKPRIDVDKVTFKGELSGRYNTALITLKKPDGDICWQEPIFAKDGIVSYSFTMPQTFISGMYQIGIDDVFGEFGYVNASEQASLVTLAKGTDDTALADKIIAYKNELGMGTYTDDQIKDFASVVVENNSAVAGYRDLLEMMKSVPETLKEVNESPWGNLATIISSNHKLLLNDNADYTYFSGLNDTSKNLLISKYLLAGKTEFNSNFFTDIKDFRNKFKKAVSNYKADTSAPTPTVPSQQSSGGGGGGGGIQITQPIANSINRTQVFKDLGSVSWAKDSIMLLYQKGIIAEADEFRPNDDITREEFIKIIVEAFFKDKQYQEHTFADEKSGEWYNKYISTAYEYGIISGYPDGSVGIGKKISREEMVVIIGKTLEILGDYLNYETYEDFSDKDSISDFAKKYVNAMRNAGVVNGMGDNTFAPQNFATRAQAAKIIAGILK